MKNKKVAPLLMIYMKIWLLTITIILNGLGNESLSIAEKEAISYTPYDIAYINIMEKNKRNFR